MPTEVNNTPPNIVGKTVHVNVGTIMDPGITSYVDIDVDDDDQFTIGDPTKLTKTGWRIVIDYGAAVAEAYVDDDGDAVVINEVGTSTSKFSSTVGATNAQYQFGISSGDLVFKNTDGANKHVQVSRLN